MFVDLVGLLIFILDIYVIYMIVAGRNDPGVKVIWIIVVLILPLLGPILYFLFGQGRTA